MTHPHPELGTPPKLAPDALRIVALGLNAMENY